MPERMLFNWIQMPPMMNFIFVLPIVFSLFPLSPALNCSRTPIYVDIHQRHVHGSDSLQYGSFAGFGSPAQNQSLFPSLTHNETSVAANNFCLESNLTDCSSSTGGFFESNDSTTWAIDKAYKSTDNGSDSTNAVFGADIVHVYIHYIETTPASETTADQFPLEVISRSRDIPGKLGLGPESTLLTKLYDNDLISSRSYGLYVGNGSPKAKGSINGSLTLGGYDSKRFDGTVYNHTLDGASANSFAVHVKQILLHDEGGEVQNVSLVTDGGFDARITTDQYTLSLPSDVTQRYITAINATPSGDDAGSLKANMPFNGTMSITLSTGFTVKLENITWTNPVAEAQTDNSDEPFYLGGAWLNQVYLMTNYDDNTFRLAQAVPNADFISVETLCPGTIPRPYTKPNISSFSRAGLVGAVIGGVGAFVFFSVFGCCMFISRRRARRMKSVHWFKGTKGGVKISTFEVEHEPVMAVTPVTPAFTGQGRPRWKQWRH